MIYLFESQGYGEVETKMVCLLSPLSAVLKWLDLSGLKSLSFIPKIIDPVKAGIFFFPVKGI